jgi:aminobenzoyl-glutamate utilization protein B
MTTTRILWTCLVSAVLVLPEAGARPTADACKKDAMSWLDANNETLVKAAGDIHRFAETALREKQSAELLASLLERSGFTVERGVAGMPTAFVATYGSGYPVVGFLAEYDALPGLSQESGSAKQAPVEQGGPGHGCGHNLLGTASVGAAMAMKEIMAKHKLDGTVKLFGCPAEETLVGKIYMARDGVFDGVDVCFNWHPSSSNHASLAKTIAMNNFEVVFRGKTAHAAGDPWDGRSALDAAELMSVGVNYLREHIKPTVRIHSVIVDGGKAPNIVPDYVKTWYFVRDNEREGVEEVYERVLKCAEGAALMTGTTWEAKLLTGTYSYMPNHELTRVQDKNLRIVGAPAFTAEDHAFGKALQRAFGVEEKGFSTNVTEYKDEETRGGGSTDVADVTRLVPTSGEMDVATLPPGIAGHSWGVTAASGSPAGMKGMLVAAKTLALSGIDCLLDTKIVERAQAEFKEKTKDFTFRSAVPAGQAPPLPEESR